MYVPLFFLSFFLPPLLSPFDDPHEDSWGRTSISVFIPKSQDWDIFLLLLHWFFHFPRSYFRFIMNACIMVQSSQISQFLITHFHTSSGVNERLSEKMSERAKQAVRSMLMSERCKWMSERTSECPSIFVGILGCSGPWWHTAIKKLYWHPTVRLLS